MRLAFMGTPDFAVPALEAVAAAGHEVACVYSQPPRPAGRGHRVQPSPVQARAEALGVPVRYPRTLRDPAAQAEFAALDLDAAVVAAYGLILPAPVLRAPRLGCVNIHASLLPRWRGAAPIQRALLAGDAETGVTIMQMDEGLDTGAMLRAGRVPIGPRTTASELHDALAALGARLVVETLADLEAGRVRPEPQPAEGVTYASKLSRDEGQLDWRRPSAELERAVRALNPWPGVWFEHGGERIKVLAADLAEGKPGAPPGRVLAIDAGLVVACADGRALRLTRLQRPGREPVDAAAFLRGYALPPGADLPIPEGPCPATS
jgi:methionyl-tRNA formyltransferase